MRNFVNIADGIDTVPALLQLHANPHLWDADTLRKDRDGSPHTSMSDIWVRYCDDAATETPQPMQWLTAWAALPALRPIVFGLMARVEATALGGILITRIPAGGRIAPHVDGNWHARKYRTKVYVPLQSNPACVNECGGERVAMAPGSAWTFDNTVSHSVENGGADDRITLIVCMDTA
jgi:hypothetical protein